MLGIFKKKVKSDGYIKYFGLQEIWVNTLSEEQRNEVKNRISKGLNTNPAYVDTGNIDSTSETKSRFLVTMAEGVLDIQTKDKLLQKALIEMKSDIVDNHFVLMNIANEYKKMIKSDESLYEKQIEVLKKDCFIYDQFAKAYYKLDYVLPDENLPNYPAFKELAIAYERTGEIEKAIEISKVALQKKVNENTSFENRISKLEKILSR